ncbi:DUF1611 domain-containing protein [Sandaracinobacter neustonicus]|uniref:DUF1611 domain-containing protein n=1 Tax=Sandaracinobacter neustonicus TaxID=1715348 RepID=A0A501XJ25_9SPHN|nr:DUF1611 domain-containing protein [Sandaracinobacter neustonicus]TPE60550.1 DUF1611 domain-containing protein [Sandaracinobacter neustonicus]
MNAATDKPVTRTELPTPYLLFMGDMTEPGFAKTAFGLHQWVPERCVGELAFSGSVLSTGLPRLSAADGKARGARAVVIGVAHPGGALAESWIAPLVGALEAGLDITSGMHGRLGDNPALADAARRHGRTLFDVRVPPAGIPIGTGAKRSGKRLLTVGTDCALGKKYTALAVARAMQARGIAADFRATGQTGILIAGGGIPMDAVVSDFLAGAAELLSPAAAPDHWDVVEGQGSLFHPSYAAVTLGLLHGSQPDVILLCHQPGRTHILGRPDYPIPDLGTAIEAYLAAGRLTNSAIRCGGISLNTAALDEDAAAAEIARTEDRYGLPAADPLRGGPALERLIDFSLNTTA